MTKRKTQRGSGIIGDIGDFIKKNHLLSGAAKALIPVASAFHPAAGIGAAAAAQGLSQAGWGRQKIKPGGHKNNNIGVPVVSASYGQVKF